MMEKPGFLAVLGIGESGVGAAILGKDRGWSVLVSDSGRPAERFLDTLRREQIDFEVGGHSTDRILTADLVVKSPGIPGDIPLIKALRRRGVPIISEIEFAGRYARGAKMVCITGSNGKTTTTLLTCHILTQAGLNPGLAGNVGRSLALQVARDPHDIYVIELSSFQLDDMYDFKAHIAVMMNITPDHLDRYDHRMENYVSAKFRILQNQTADDAFIYFEDDPVIAAQLRQITVHARQLPFSLDRHPDSAAWVDPCGELHFSTSETSMLMPREELSLSGLHNLYNSMAAVLSACLLSVDKQAIRRSLADFEGVEHRLEFVTTINGVKWINDSKATNVNSTFYALGAMPDGRRTILILGGKDKGNDYSEILPEVREKVRAIVAMGVDNTKILNFFNGEVDTIVDTHSLDDAVSACRSLAREGDTVLLSPCCASFDLFHSFEERGKLFKERVIANS